MCIPYNFHNLINKIIAKNKKVVNILADNVMPNIELHPLFALNHNAYKTLQCKGYARIDCFYQSTEQSPTNQARVVIIEVNTLPGLTPATCLFHQAAEVSLKPRDFLDTLITLGFEEHTPASIIKSQQVAQKESF